MGGLVGGNVCAVSASQSGRAGILPLLQETSLAAAQEIIREVDQTNAFVVAKDEPDFSTWAFLGEFEREQDFHLFGLIARSEMVGFISVLPHAGQDALDIGPMYVRPRFRGRGWGRAQIAGVVEWAGARGTRRLYLRTWGQNARVRHIVEKLGFRLDREIPNARIDGDSTVYYVLDMGALP